MDEQAMKINSKRKGKIGELEWVNVLKDFGYQAKRGQQFKGTEDSPDVLCDDLPIHWEVKRVEALNINKAMTQAKDDAGNKVPVVAHRKNNSEWLVTLSAKDFLECYSRKI